ncbi:MAG: LD-carboxypeptidase [Prochloraceae cyanobacterium]|nr:LD-carboxypeptidase [Prochloraceae cyanobacterium]
MRKISNPSRRQFIQLCGLSLFSASANQYIITGRLSRQNIKPKRLQIGDTVGLISPASQINPEDIESVKRFLTQQGLKVKQGLHIFDRYGYLAGKDDDRAADVNAMFADKQVKAILTTRGGWGVNRILPMLDYNLIGKNPKIVMGFSDITSLLLAIYARTGIITFHGPVIISTWNQFSFDYVRQILFQGKAVTLKNPISIPLQTITKGIARGRLLGGNLSVITSTIGSTYLPQWKGAILFVEEIGEDIYRVDRMLTQLKLAGILQQLAGFIFAQCTKCIPEDDSEPYLTLSQVIAHHIKPLGIPAWYGAAIGHIKDKFTVPVGLEVEIDANSGEIKMLEAAVI